MEGPPRGSREEGSQGSPGPACGREGAHVAACVGAKVIVCHSPGSRDHIIPDTGPPALSFPADRPFSQAVLLVLDPHLHVCGKKKDGDTAGQGCRRPVLREGPRPLSHPAPVVFSQQEPEDTPKTGLHSKGTCCLRVSWASGRPETEVQGAFWDVALLPWVPQPCPLAGQGHSPGSARSGRGCRKLQETQDTPHSPTVGPV